MRQFSIWIFSLATGLTSITVFQNCAPKFGTDTGNPLLISSQLETPQADGVAYGGEPMTSSMTSTLSQGLAMQLCNRATACGNITDFDACLYGVKTNFSITASLFASSIRDLNEAIELEEKRELAISSERSRTCLNSVQTISCQAIEGLEDSRTDFSDLFSNIASCSHIDAQ